MITYVLLNAMGSVESVAVENEPLDKATMDKLRASAAAEDLTVTVKCPDLGIAGMFVSIDCIREDREEAEREK